jgi:RNA polymerase sigma-70 factor (ECF subfamily)
VPGSADDQRLRELFLKHGPAVYRRAHRLLGNHADAEEATQEVFIRVMRGEEGFEGRSQVTTWLYRITTNYCLNQIRDRRRRQELMEENPPDDERSAPAAPADLVLLRRLLSEADEQQARAAIYVHLDGMSHEEAAELLGVAKRTVGNLLDRFRDWVSRKVGLPESVPQVSKEVEGQFHGGTRRS